MSRGATLRFFHFLKRLGTFEDLTTTNPKFLILKTYSLVNHVKAGLNLMIFVFLFIKIG